jgi:hypothetical protein
MRRYALTYFVKGERKEIVSQYFNRLLEIKRQLIESGITVLFSGTNETLREDLA